MPEAATVMSDCAGTPEDNVVFSQGFGGNSTVYLLHPEEHTHGTWSVSFLHLQQETKSTFTETCKHKLSVRCALQYLTFV